MALIKPSELRKMSPEERAQKLEELRKELMYERGVAAMGGAPVNPGRLRALRHSIARILTVENELAKEEKE